jgi:CubicO group peptidase (beta-lactamase class C family)
MKWSVRAAWLLLLWVAPVLAVHDDKIELAAAYSAHHGETSLLVWRGGRVVYERGARQVVPPRIFSITKSLVSIGVFRDAKTGGLSLGQAATHQAARGVSLADLLNQTSGLPAAHREFYAEGLNDKEPVLQRLRQTGGRGSFVYGPSHWEVLAEEIRVQRGASLEGWLRKFVPGADSAALARWRRDDQGRLFFSTGARMGARDLLPAGREVLSGMRRGRWPADVRALLSSGTEANRMYALGFWLNRGSQRPGAREVAVESSLGSNHGPDFWRGGCLSRVAPKDLLAMIGTRGQRVYVIPSQDLVVIRLGAGKGFSDAEFLRRLFG